MKKCRVCHIPLEGAISKIIGPALKRRPSQDDPTLCSRCASKNKAPRTYVCSICRRPIDEESALTHVKAEEYLLELIRKDHPQWKEEEGACLRCVEYYRELIRKAKI